MSLPEGSRCGIVSPPSTVCAVAGCSRLASYGHCSLILAQSDERGALGESWPACLAHASHFRDFPHGMIAEHRTRDTRILHTQCELCRQMNDRGLFDPATHSVWEKGGVDD